MDMKHMSAMGGSPSSQAKKDVLLALKKMAMEMMSEGSGEEEHPAGVMAKLDVKKLTPGMEIMAGDDTGGDDSALEEGSESDEDKIAELEAQIQELKAKKLA